ncbi:MAG: signal peptidase I, partial [Clostridia bacterium]|nr:signal peptidase I [Clostridia bacterium]
MNRQFTAREMRILRAEAEQQYENIRGARFYRNVDFLLYIVAVILAALVIRAFFAEPIRVDGDSMLPTLIDGEHMLVEKISFWTREPERGEIIICFYPGYTESCVKRVIGLPGETVAIRDG